MAFKAILFSLSIFLLITSEVTSTDEPKMKGAPYAKPPVSAPATSPSKPPATAPVVPTPPMKAPTPMPPTASPMPPIRSKADCIPLCEKRCSLHSRKRLCIRACTTCCARCKCVPPGTYGNREKCGKCYTDMTTRGNKLKCP